LIIKGFKIISKPYFARQILKSHKIYIMSVLVNKDSKIIVQGLQEAKERSMLLK
jgi:hypothetical protein